MAKIEKKTKRYPRDLTYEEWSAVEPFLAKEGEAQCPKRGYSQTFTRPAVREGFHRMTMLC
jgi:hypothetical protein